MTTLDEEARCAQDYVRLMNMRKQDLVGLDLQLNELPENLPVMRFLFQPLCENAIQHGMETGRPLHIRIRGWQAGAQVHLVVENDGAMIPLDKLAMLRLQTPPEMDEQPLGAPAPAVRRGCGDGNHLYAGNHEHRNHLPPAHAGGNSGGNGQRKG